MNPFTQAIKELAQYLGKKIDELIAVSKTQKISFDFGESTEKLGKAADRMASAIATIEKTAESQDISKLQTEIRRAVSTMQTFADVVTRNIENLDTNAVAQATTQTNSLMERLILAVKGLKLHAPATDVSGLLKELQAMRRDMASKGNADLVNKLQEVMQAIAEIKLVVPGEVRIDGNQFRALTAKSGSAATPFATNARTVNVALTAANTEYSYSFPNNTVSWTMKLRSNAGVLQYAWTTGTLPTSGDGSAYVTHYQGVIRSQDGVNWSGKTIYLQSTTAAQVVELDIYTM